MNLGNFVGNVHLESNNPPNATYWSHQRQSKKLTGGRTKCLGFRVNLFRSFNLENKNKVNVTIILYMANYFLFLGPIIIPLSFSSLYTLPQMKYWDGIDVIGLGPVPFMIFKIIVFVWNIISQLIESKLWNATTGWVRRMINF